MFTHCTNTGGKYDVGPSESLKRSASFTDADLSSLLHYAHLLCYTCNVLNTRWLYGVHIYPCFVSNKTCDRVHYMTIWNSTLIRAHPHVFSGAILIVAPPPGVIYNKLYWFVLFFAFLLQHGSQFAYGHLHHLVHQRVCSTFAVVEPLYV